MTAQALIRLQDLKFSGIANALEAQLEQNGTYGGLSFIGRLSLLADREHLIRKHRKQDRRGR